MTAAVAVATLGIVGTPASAQTAAPTVNPPRWTISVAGASMHPLHGDDRDEGPVVLGSVGFAATRNFRIEGEVSWRTHTTEFVNTDVFLFGGTNGIHGHADRTVLGAENTDWTAGVNFIGHTGWRVVSLFGGPGVVFHRENERNYRTVQNCTPPIPSNGAECSEFGHETSSNGTGLQLIAGVDVALHRNVALFVAGRAEYRKGLTFGGVGLMGGLRTRW